MPDNGDIMDVVRISRQEYEHLKDRAYKLDCLEAHGVDNWEGYDDAMDEYESEE